MYGRTALLIASTLILILVVMRLHIQSLGV